MVWDLSVSQFAFEATEIYNLNCLVNMGHGPKQTGDIVRQYKIYATASLKFKCQQRPGE